MVRLLYVLLLMFSAAVFAQNTATGPHIEVALVSEHNQVRVGETQWVGVLLNPDKDWHTYWLNPGDSGEAPTIQWQSDSDIEFGDIHWPLPKPIQVAHLVNYGYEGATLLMVPINLKQATKDRVSIIANLSWLVCKEDCIPGWATLTIDLPIADSITPSEHANLFEQTRLTLPEKHKDTAQFELTSTHLGLQITLPYQSDWHVFPFKGDVISHNADQAWAHQANSSQVVISLSDYFATPSEPLNFLISDGKNGFYVEAIPNDTSSADNNSPSQSLWLMLLFAFIGGLILNIMPCVLPILSMKALSFTQSKHVNHWGYPVGVLISFWLFASIILVLKEAGSAVGWGFHLQEPLLIAGLAFLFTFIAMMLWDLLPKGINLAGVGQSLTGESTFTQQFFTGVLAVVVASPCTAPFMATALGVAMISPMLDTLAIFTALAVGFALPMTLLSLSTRFAKLLPKPGAWMQTFKHFLGFPMLATVVWLTWIFLSQTSSFGQLWLLSGLLGFVFFVWVSAKVNRVCGVMSLLLAIVFATFCSIKGAQASKVVSEQKNNHFSAQKLTELRNNNHVVLVNMTADWCITCKVNEQVALNNADLQALFEDSRVDYLVGDWTNKNQAIYEYLEQYQRSGVPLYVVYAGNHSKRVLPQVLTPDIVINAIQQAKKEINHATSN